MSERKKTNKSNILLEAIEGLPVLEDPLENIEVSCLPSIDKVIEMLTCLKEMGYTHVTHASAELDMMIEPLRRVIDGTNPYNVCPSSLEFRMIKSPSTAEEDMEQCNK